MVFTINSLNRLWYESAAVTQNKSSVLQWKIINIQAMFSPSYQYEWNKYLYFTERRNKTCCSVIAANFPIQFELKYVLQTSNSWQSHKLTRWLHFENPLLNSLLYFKVLWKKISYPYKEYVTFIFQTGSVASTFTLLKWDLKVPFDTQWTIWSTNVDSSHVQSVKNVSWSLQALKEYNFKFSQVNTFTKCLVQLHF